MIGKSTVKDDCRSFGDQCLIVMNVSVINDDDVYGEDDCYFYFNQKIVFHLFVDLFCLRIWYYYCCCCYCYYYLFIIVIYILLCERNHLFDFQICQM